MHTHTSKHTRHRHTQMHTHSLTHSHIHTNAPVDVLGDRANSEMAVERQPSLRDFFEQVASEVECFRFVARVLSQEEEDEAEDEGEEDADLFAVLVVWSRFSGFAASASILPRRKKTLKRRKTKTTTKKTKRKRRKKTFFLHFPLKSS
jgi:hypothetical protein